MWNARVFIILTCSVFLFIESKRFDTRCKLVRELLRVGIPNDHLLGQCRLRWRERCPECWQHCHVEWQCSIFGQNKAQHFVHPTAVLPPNALPGLYKNMAGGPHEPSVSTPNGTNIILSGVCLAEKVSNRDTSALTTKGGKKYYGLYQIPNQWCKQGRPGGDCNVRCEALLDDDIRDDTMCAVTIFHREGFKYWKLWETRCKNDNLITSEIYKCPDLTSPRSSPERTYSSDILRYRRMLMYKSLARARNQPSFVNSPVRATMRWA